MGLLTAAQPYSLYILVILMVVYLLNQLDRFVLGIASKDLVRDLKFGEKSCFLNTSELDSNLSCSTYCNEIDNLTA